MKRNLVVLKRAIVLEWSIILALQISFSFDIELPRIYSIGLLAYAIILTLISFLVINKLVARQSNQLVYLLMFMLIMALFAYPLKQLWIYTDPDILSVFSLVNGMIDLAPQSIGWFLFVQYSAIFMLLLGIYLCTLIKNKIVPSMRESIQRDYKSKKLSFLLITTTFLLMIILLFAMKRFGMYMGSGGVSLPFHMAGVILYSHLILIPVLMLLCVLVLPQKAGWHYMVAVILMFLTYIIGDMVVRLSRSSLLVVLMLLLGVIITARPEKIKKFLRLGVISVLATIVLIPMVTSLRMAQVNENWSSSYIYEQYNYYSETVFSLFVMRITGAENAAVVIDSIDFNKVNVVGVLKQGVISYYTHDVLKFPEGGNTAFTPSALGEVFIVFGSIAGLLVIFLMPFVLSHLNWIFYKNLRFSYPIAYAFLFALAIKMATGGVFMKDIYTIAGAVALAFFIDIVLKLKAISFRPRKLEMISYPKVKKMIRFLSL